MTKKIGLAILIIVISIILASIYGILTYGNVKIYMKTGFDYSDIDKIQIVGKLSEKLSERLHYKDTIFIEYIQDYTNIYGDDLYMLEFNNSNYKIIGGIKSEYTIKSNNSGLSVRIYADRINIVEILKLVEFTITNKEKTNSYLTKKEIGFNRYKEQPLNSIATDDKIIDKIYSSESELIKELINERILVNEQDNYGIEIYWMNDKFIFEYNHIHSDKQEFVFELKDYFYHKYLNVNDILIFVNKNSFYYLDGTNDEKKELVKMDNTSYAPLIIMNFGNKVLFHPFRNRNQLSIFLKDKNKVISKFE